MQLWRLSPRLLQTREPLRLVVNSRLKASDSDLSVMLNLQLRTKDVGTQRNTAVIPGI